MMNSRLGAEYTSSIHAVYGNRLPATLDLCCYWFEKASSHVVEGKCKRVGLLGTQGIRGSANRIVLDRIKENGAIFMAYPDTPWYLDGAEVHISIVGFDDGSEELVTFDGQPIDGNINSNLTVGVNTTLAQKLKPNRGLSFRRPGSVNRLDIDGFETATTILNQPLNVNHKPNEDVVRPVFNASDTIGNARGLHRIAFSSDDESECAMYEAPFEQAKSIVGDGINQPDWWKHERTSTNIKKLEGLERYIATPRHSKHRIFVWFEPHVITTDALVVFLRDDDYFFGVLHSYFHERWTRSMGTQVRDVESGFRYTPTTCFDTFPLPSPNRDQRRAIGDASAGLNVLRENWLHPVGISSTELETRTLTNLYNEGPTWLTNAHAKLDAAVADAYGWPVDLSDEEILERLLALNLERAAAQ